MKEAVIVSAVRTPVGRYMGALKDIQAFDLAAPVLNEVIKRAGLNPRRSMKSSWGNLTRTANMSISPA